MDQIALFAFSDAGSKGLRLCALHWQQILVKTTAYPACSSILRLDGGHISAVLNQVRDDLVGSVVIVPK